MVYGPMDDVYIGGSTGMCHVQGFEVGHIGALIGAGALTNPSPCKVPSGSHPMTSPIQIIVEGELERDNWICQ